MSRKGAAFTLIELLVVLVIIGVIIAIVLPALGIVRTISRKSATDGMLRQITNAVGAFQNDHKRLPGYFNARDMAHPENADPSGATGGFSAMQNLMLELAGFQQVPSGGVLIGPRATAQVMAEPNSIGVGGEGLKAYWVPDRRHLTPQNETSGQQVGTGPNMAWPSVVDEWQNPILAWAKDETAVGQAKNLQQFAKIQLSSPQDAPAQFYWAPNAAFLQATAFGKRATNQAADSAIGLNATNQDRSLAGMLGNPNDPCKSANPPDPVLGIYSVPGSPRAPFMVQSAGADGVFVGKNDRGYKPFSALGFIDYRLTFAPDVNTPPSATNQWTDKNDKPTNRDVMTPFDDVLVHGGN
jgi:prepilin-type N-terminal cleavage/methylation domain-containing protein